MCILHFSSNTIKEENFGSIHLETVNSAKVKCIKHSVLQICLASFHLFVYFALKDIFICSVCGFFFFFQCVLSSQIYKFIREKKPTKCRTDYKNRMLEALRISDFRMFVLLLFCFFVTYCILWSFALSTLYISYLQSLIASPIAWCHSKKCKWMLTC